MASCVKLSAGEERDELITQGNIENAFHESGNVFNGDHGYNSNSIDIPVMTEHRNCNMDTNFHESSYG